MRRSGSRRCGWLVLATVLVSCSDDDPPVLANDRGPTRDSFASLEAQGVVPSAYLDEGLVVAPGVFDPGEAEEYVLPLMQENPKLFRGKRVLEIGTGSGAIGLFAAKLGASRVVATDIDPVALQCAEENARRMGLLDVFETRLVSPDDLSAYAVLEPGEQFDVILSNPPYSLDLDADYNTYAVDTGDLGLSIVQGLPERLAEDGVVFLLYNSLFYHHVMVKFAEREGYEVRNHTPSMLTPWEGQTLFNAYMERYLEQQGVDSSGMEFDFKQDRYLDRVRIASKVEPLFRGNSDRHYPGMIVIERD